MIKTTQTTAFANLAHAHPANSGHPLLLLLHSCVDPRSFFRDLAGVYQENPGRSFVGVRLLPDMSVGVVKAVGKDAMRKEPALLDQVRARPHGRTCVCVHACARVCVCVCMRA
jgi:hypothetical protein